MKFIHIVAVFCSFITYSSLMSGSITIDATSSFEARQWVVDGTFNIEGNNTRIGVLSGTGLIKGNKFVLRCKEFNFKGTIECDGECVIFCQNLCDYSSLTLKGNGSITIIINPYAYDFRRFNESSLSIAAKNLLISNLLDKTDEDFEKQINLIRTHSALNKLDENQIFNAVIEMLDQKINYHTEHQNDIFDPAAENKKIYKDRSKAASTSFAIATAGLLPMVLFARTSLSQKFSADNMLKITFSGLIVSVIGTLVTAAILAEAYPQHINPQHKKRLSKLYAIKKKIEQALATPHILEKELAIKLQ